MPDPPQSSVFPPVEVGDRNGKRVIVELRKGKQYQKIVVLRCDCGGLAQMTLSDYHRKPLPHCQRCQPNRRTHGKTGTPEYTCWQRMLSRCYQPSHPHYHYYGGRGITVCPEWRESFDAFLRDVGLRPTADLTFDRIDVNGNYEPGNVRWATRLVQSRNRRPYGKKKAG